MMCVLTHDKNTYTAAREFCNEHSAVLPRLSTAGMLATVMIIIATVSFSSFWKWVALPMQALKKMGNATQCAMKNG